MTGAVEEAGKATASFIDALKREPLSLALVLMNLALLGFFYVLLTRVADQREREVKLLYEDKKTVNELLSKCVVPERRTDLYEWPVSPVTSLPELRPQDDAETIVQWPPLPRPRPKPQEEQP